MFKTSFILNLRSFDENGLFESMQPQKRFSDLESVIAYICSVFDLEEDRIQFVGEDIYQKNTCVADLRLGTYRVKIIDA